MLYMRYIFVTYAIYATYILHVMQSMYAIYAMFTICNISNILNIQLFHCLHDMYTINLNLNWYIFPLSRARRAQRHPQTYPHSPNCWHDVGNTNENNNLHITSPIVGTKYTILMQTSTDIQPPHPGPEGPKDTHQLIYIPPIVGMI